MRQLKKIICDNSYKNNHKANKMKKSLLTFAAAAATVFTGMANEYTFVFDGTNDMGGLTRQTSTKQADLTFAESFALSEEGVDLSIKNISDKGIGFALINAGGMNAGLCVFSSLSVPMTPEISLTVPGGKITSVVLNMSGSGLTSLDIPFNGKELECSYENSLGTWTWSDTEGAETVTCSWVNSYYARYIHSIKVVYTPDLGGKQACGLSFAYDAVEAVLGESFTAPHLSNPNKLDVTWTSSDENVASVDQAGKITLIGGGKTVITASTEGNDEFAAGNAKYELDVIPSASNIAQLLEYAPGLYDRVKVNFPATVNFANGSIAFVTDAEGNAACFDDIRNRNSTSTATTTLYSVGQVIPAGWIATNATIYESVIWEGIPSKPTEKVSVEYPRVTSVTPEDTDRVVILENVTFQTRTAEGMTKAYGTTPDGTTYEFQDTYNVASKAAGTYDVTGVVRYSKRGSTVYFYIAPIAYAVSEGSSVEFEAAEAAEARYYNLRGEEIAEPESGVYVKVVNGKSTKVIKK